MEKRLVGPCGVEVSSRACRLQDTRRPHSTVTVVLATNASLFDVHSRLHVDRPRRVDVGRAAGKIAGNVDALSRIQLRRTHQFKCGRPRQLEDHYEGPAAQSCVPPITATVPEKVRHGQRVRLMLVERVSVLSRQSFRSFVKLECFPARR